MNRRDTTEQISFLDAFTHMFFPESLFSAVAEERTLFLAIVSIIIGFAAGFYRLRYKQRHVSNALILLCDNILWFSK